MQSIRSPCRRSRDVSATRDREIMIGSAPSRAHRDTSDITRLLAHDARPRGKRGVKREEKKKKQSISRRRVRRTVIKSLFARSPSRLTPSPSSFLPSQGRGGITRSRVEAELKELRRVCVCARRRSEIRPLIASRESLSKSPRFMNPRASAVAVTTLSVVIRYVGAMGEEGREGGEGTVNNSSLISRDRASFNPSPSAWSHSPPPLGFVLRRSVPRLFRSAFARPRRDVECVCVCARERACGCTCALAKRTSSHVHSADTFNSLLTEETKTKKRNERKRLKRNTTTFYIAIVVTLYSTSTSVELFLREFAKCVCDHRVIYRFIIYINL